MGAQLGQGSLGLAPRTKQPGAPFADSAVKNGLSIDAVDGKIQLGEDSFNVVATYHFNSDRYLNTGAGGFALIIGRTGIAQQIEIRSAAVSAVNTSNGQSGSLAAAFLSLVDPAFDAPGIRMETSDPNNLMQIANISGVLTILDRNNNGIIQCEEATGNTVLTSNAGQNVVGDFSQAIVQIGDCNEATNNLAILVNNGAEEEIRILGRNLPSDPQTWFLIQQLLRSVQIGDVSGYGNGTSIQIDDAAGDVNIQLSNNLNINGNAGFTGTVANPTSITVVNGIVTAVS